MQNDRQPLVSICVINYNSSAYIKDCIQSILNQTYKNIEIVFCDDASTDNSIEIFENLIKGNRYITVNRQYQKANIGVEQNMLAGIRAFTGDFICNIDCDDALAPNHIEILVNLLFYTSADIASTNHIEFDSEKPDYNTQPPHAPQIQDCIVLSAKEAMEALFLRDQKIPFAYWHRIYRRNNAKNITEIPINYFTNSDSAFSLAQLCNADKIAYLDTPTYLYRVRQQSISHKSWHDYLLKKTLYSLDKLTEYFSIKHPYLVALNEYRNNKALSWIFDAAVNERKGYSKIRSHYNAYVNITNRDMISNFLTESLHHRVKNVIKMSFKYTPLPYYIYRRVVRLLKRKTFN